MAIAVLWILARLDFVVAPLVLAWFIAYLLDPAVDRLESWHIPRTVSVLFLLLVFLFVTVLTVLWVFPILTAQLREGLAAFPGYLESWKGRLGILLEPVLRRPLPEESSRLVAEFTRILEDNLPQLARGAPAVVRGLFANAWRFVGAVLGVAIIPVFAFYLLVVFDRLDDRFVELFPVRNHDTVRRLLDRCDEVLGGFVRGQLTVCVILALVYSVGLSFTGIDMPWVVGSVSGILFFVPYLGTLIGVVAGSVLALLKFQDVAHLLGVWGVFAVGQALEGFFLTPRIVGDRVGLNPIAVIVSVLVGGQLLGAPGVLLAVPAAAVIRVGMEEAMSRYRASEFYHEGGKSGEPG